MCCTGLFCYDETTGTKRLGGHDPQHARTMLEFAKAMVWSSQAIKTPLGDTVQGIVCCWEALCRRLLKADGCTRITMSV
eukprot:1136624-Pelagomonas_calceolata.AAC.1